MNRTRNVLTGLVVTAAVAAPLAAIGAVGTAGPARAAVRNAPVLTVYTGKVFLSPNKDKVQDKATLSFWLRKKSNVTVKVRRDNKARALVFKGDLGKLDGHRLHRWKWNGRDSDGDVVRDGRYSAIIVADQVRQDGVKQTGSSVVWVDTKFTQVNPPALTLDTIYPQTTLFRDAVGVTLAGNSNKASVRTAEMRVRDEQRRLVRTIPSSGRGWDNEVQTSFDGRDAAGAPLAGGKYTIRFKVTDRAGNTGLSDTVTLNIAGKPLVEKTGTLTLPATGTWKASQVMPGTAPAPTPPSSPAPGTTSPYPCGKVVPSEVYPNPGATSFRSDEACTGSYAVKGAYAFGSVELDNLTFDVAPRGGLYSAKVSMRGRPTVAGETDTATLAPGATFGFNGVLETPNGVSSAAVAEETVTALPTVTTPPAPRAGQTYFEKPRYWQAPRVGWAVVTRGTDSFDVADVTVTYTYLAPQE